ncbi:MAG: hypothetical protein AB1489_33560, partial [Acidobacteriota bacterium]
ARWAIQQDINPAPFFDKATAAYLQAGQLNSQDAEVYQVRAELYYWQAQWYIKKGNNADKEISEGLAMVKKALSINNQAAEGTALAGALILLQSQSISSPARRREALKQAQELLAKALQMNSLLRRTYQPLLVEAQSKAQKG